MKTHTVKLNDSELEMIRMALNSASLRWREAVESGHCREETVSAHENLWVKIYKVNHK